MKFIVKVMDERLKSAEAKGLKDFDLLPIMLYGITLCLTFVGTASMEKPIWRRLS